jgi:FAD/FMN-containing dehydrogenase
MSGSITRRQILTALGAGTAALAVAAGPAARVAKASPANGLADLQAALGSEVLLPGDSGYAAEAAGFNTLVQQSPQAIVVAETPQDVATAIRIGASELGWPIAIQATGHGICVPADGALLINLRNMTGVEVDQVRRTARVSGGARFSDVLAVSAPLGLLPPVPSTSDVGVAGFIGGGGVSSILGRAYGFGSDGVRSIGFVTPDGTHRCLSPWEGADLFWAVRGGASNFGAMTSVEIELVPASTVYGGALVFPAAAASQVFQSWVSWTSTVSDRMTSIASFIRFPGRQVLSIEVVYLGMPADGDSELAPLRALGPVSDTVAEVPIAQVDSIYGVPKTPSASVSASGMMGALDANGVATVLGAIGFGAMQPSGVIEVRQMGGAYARQPLVPNAIGNRDADFLVFLNSPAPNPSIVPGIEQSQQATLAQLAPVLTGGRIPTFLGTLDTTPAAVSTAYAPDDWDRLVQLKHEYDPANLFRINHNIW